MENNADSYVLVLEDRSRVQSPTEAGHLSVVSSMDEAGRIKTVEPTEANQTAFMKFKKNDSVLKNFLSNLVKQFKDPTHFGVYRLVSDRAVESVAELRNMLAGREEPRNKAMLESIRMNLDEFAPAQKAPAIDESKVDWKELERLGLSRDRLEQSGDLNKLLNWQKTGLVGISVPFGETSIYTEARIALRQSEDGHPQHPQRAAARFSLYGLSFQRGRKSDADAFGQSGETGGADPQKRRTLQRLRLNRPVDQ